MNAHFRFYGPPPPSKAQWEACLDDFAELLSCDMSLKDIAEKMGTDRATPCVLLRILCERMGAQAC